MLSNASTILNDLFLPEVAILNWFSNQNIKVKLLISFILVAAIAGCVGVVGISVSTLVFFIVVISLLATGLGLSLARLIGELRSQAEAADKISKGDLSVEIIPRSENDVLSHSMKRMVETLRGVVSETGMLSKAAVDGQLGVRGDADKFEGGYREIVQGVNSTLVAGSCVGGFAICSRGRQAG